MSDPLNHSESDPPDNKPNKVSLAKTEQANFGVHGATPHERTPMDSRLAEETAERTWAAVERARAEVALRDSESRLHSIANLVPDLLWDSEPDGSTNWYNQRWLEYTGQRFEEAIGWGWVDAIHPDDREGSARRYAEAVKQGKPLQQEHRIRRHDGEYRWFVVKASPVKDENGKVVKMYGAATDIHDLKQTEEALRESEEKLRSFNNTLEQQVKDRTDDIRQLISQQRESEERQQQEIFRTILNTQEEERKRIAENLHNSLGQILYSVKLSLDQIGRADLEDGKAEALKNADKLLSNAINETRRISHELMPSILEDFGLKTAIADICRQFTNGIKLKFRFKDSALQLDKYIEVAIYRIVQELIMNIVKHSHAKDATVTIEKKRSRVIVLVQDSGDGFDQEKQKGDGIGLKAIRNQVSLLNGVLNIVSKPGDGTIINIDIPVNSKS
ncbi:PAS domain-containing protein [Mucilaginibacter sp. AW1-3]